MNQKTLYLDVSSGASGDMLLGTMVEQGADFKAILRTLKTLKGLPKFEAKLGWADRHGIKARRVEVKAPGHNHHEHRSLADVEKIIRSGRLPKSVQEGSLETFRFLAKAEARVHGSTVDKVHFHEVGATDAIVDILGTHLGYELIARPTIVSSPVGVEQGPAQGRAAHGAMILPAPATLEILRGVPLKPQPSETELCTPTGAALLVTMASRFGAMPSMTAEKVSYCTGKRENPILPSVLRGILGTLAGAGAEVDEIVEISTNLDDMSPVTLAPVAEDLMGAGALDVSITPVQMKKGRPGFVLTVLARPKDEIRLAVQILEKTTSFGVRVGSKRRYMKSREIQVRKTSYGDVRYKLGSIGGKLVTESPEPDDVLAAARKKGVSVHRAYADLQHERVHQHEAEHHHHHDGHDHGHSHHGHSH